MFTVQHTPPYILLLFPHYFRHIESNLISTINLNIFRCERLIDEGIAISEDTTSKSKEKNSDKPVLVYLHALGAAIPRALNLALQLQRYCTFKIVLFRVGGIFTFLPYSTVVLVIILDYIFYRKYGSLIQLDTITSTVELTDDFEPVVVEHPASSGKETIAHSR